MIKCKTSFLVEFIISAVKAFFKLNCLKKSFLHCKMRFITAVNPIPANGREVNMVEILFWILQTVCGSVIAYGVREVLDFLRNRRR